MPFNISRRPAKAKSPSPLEQAYAAAGLEPPNDPRPYSEQNDFLLSSVGLKRSNRHADVATAVRNLSELGYLSAGEAALIGARTSALDNAILRF